MAEETRKIILELELDTVNALENQKEINDLLKQTNKLLQEAKIGSDEYKELEKAQGLLQNRLKGLKDATKQSTSELNVQKGSVRDLQSQYTALTKALREATPGSEVLGLSFEDAKKKAFNLKQEIKGFEEELGNTAPNVGNYGDAFKHAGINVDTFGVSLSALFKMIIANPIGLIIAALALLAKALMSNDTIATVLKGVMTGLGVVLDQISGFISEVALRLSNMAGESSKTAKVIKDVLIRVLNAMTAPLQYLIALFPAVEEAMKGNFSKAAEIAGDATVQFGKNVIFLNNEMPELVDNLISATKVGIEYEKALDDIEAKQSKLKVTTQELVNVRDRLKLQSQDLARSEEERIALNEKAVAIDKRILNERLALIDEEITAQKNYINALGKDSIKREEAEFRLNDLQVERLQAINDSLKFEEIAQNKRNKIIEKQLEEQEKLTKQQEEERKKRQKEEEELAKRIIDSDNKLQQLRLNIAAKNAKSIDDRLKAELDAEDFRVEVLLSNDKLLASEREFILLDSQARQTDIHIKAEKDRLDASKKSEAERAALVQKTNDQIASYTNLAATALQNINKATLNNQLADLEEQKEKELKLAGNNSAKKKKIEEDFQKKREVLERDAAERANAIALVQAIINTSLAVTKALGSAPPPANFILAALTGAAGGAEIAAIISEGNKLEDGGIIMPKLAKGGLIGGKPHSQGGTVFTGTDGSRFEAERGELLAVVNKRDTPLLAALSKVNSIHGKAFFRDGGVRPASYLADGGITARTASQQVVESVSTKNQILEIIAAQPSPVVTVEDINAGVGRVTKVSERANI